MVCPMKPYFIHAIADSTTNMAKRCFVRHQMIRFHVVVVTREYSLSQMDVSVGKKGK